MKQKLVPSQPWIVSREGRGDRLCREYLKPKGPNGFKDRGTGQKSRGRPDLKPRMHLYLVTVSFEGLFIGNISVFWSYWRGDVEL